MRKNSAGFTILEVILAITVLTLAAGGSFILISQTIGSISVIQSRLTASYLIQEGLEIVRNIRDSNWLKNQTWNQNLGEGDWEGDYLSLSLTPRPLPCQYDDLPCQYDNLSFLGIDGSGFYGYNYSSGNETIFKRKITISKEPEEPDRLKVSVEVFWREKGQIRSLAAQEYLYNWYGYEEGMPQVCYLDGIPQTCDGAEATALGCTAGQEAACRRCDNGECGNYTSGQHGCPSGYECNSSGQCVAGCKSDGDACTAGSDCCSNYCYRDTDSDGYAAVSGDMVCQTSASLGIDCYDLNANAHPGQTSYYSSNRGDGSYDYDCDAAETKNPKRNCITDCPAADTCCLGCGAMCHVGYYNLVPSCGASGSFVTRCNGYNDECVNSQCGGSNISCPGICWCNYTNIKVGASNITVDCR